MTHAGKDWPEVSLPEAEAACVAREYQGANVILEYGSGGSTLLASRMQGKRVFSVESDRSWAQRIQARIDALDLPSPATVYFVDIGPTGDWGRPINTESWSQFSRYPLDVWQQPFFRHPDVVLVDGRFRAACLATVGMLCQRPVRVLFDDYVDRSLYHIVEELFRPTEVIGRMAIFDVQPGLVHLHDFPKVMRLFSLVTYHGDPVRYEVN